MVRELLKFKQVVSTQDILKRFVENKKELAVFSYRQRKGRGRYKREWFSPSGGLYLSVLLFPEREINNIPLIACLAVIESLKEMDFGNITIHWPNDIMLNNKKVCGILCERVNEAVICGIGLNVNIRRFPSRLTNATSLFIESHKVYNLEDLLHKILNKFWKLYDSLQKENLKITNIYHYVSGIGEPVEIKLSSKETIRGTIHNIDEDWSLLVRTEEGIIKRIYYGDVIRLI